jgi:hypothetical protein
MTPGQIEIRAKHAGGSSAFSFKRQIALTRNGAGITFVMETEDGKDVVATQDIDSDTPKLGDEGDSIADTRSARAKETDAKARAAMPIPTVELRYVAGHVIYVKPDGSLWVAPFDKDQGRVTDAPLQIGAHVAITPNGIAQFAVSRNGNVAYLPEGPRTLVLVSRDGRMHNVTEDRRMFSSPRFSPDGKNISVDINDADRRDVWTIKLNGGNFTRATSMLDAHDATWTPDGKSITFTSYRLGALGVYRQKIGASSSPDSVITAQSLSYSGEWLHDGSGLVTVATNLRPKSGLDIALISDSGRGPIVPVLADQFDTRFPAVSHDGQWLAYVSNVSGRDEVYVRRWNRNGAPWRISGGGATEPVWSPDGSMLFYRETRTQFLVLASLLRSPDRVLVATKQGLFPIGAMVPGFNHANFDLSPDGQSFVMILRSAPSGIKVVTNAPEIFRRARTSVPAETGRAPE